MKIKKYVAVILTAAMAFSLAGCAKGGAKKYEKALEELEFETIDEWDEDDFVDEMEDGIYYSTKDEKEVKKICKVVPIQKVKAKNVSSVFIAGKYDDKTYGSFSVYSVTFKNKDDAQKAYDKTVDMLEDRLDGWKDWYDKDQYDSDDGDDFYAIARVESSGTFIEVIMDDSKTVTYITGDFNSADDVYDDYEAFYEAIERDCPTGLVKNKVDSKKSHNAKISDVVEQIG